MSEETFKQMLPALVKNYQPAPMVKEAVRSSTLLMTVGPSGVGKTTIMRELGYPLALSTVTRGRRTNEIDGIDYHFRYDYENLVEEIKNGQFLQVNIGAVGDFYGTKASEYPPDSISTMAVTAESIPIFENLGFKQLIEVFITPPSFKEWMRRISAHDLSNDQLQKRLIEGQTSLNRALEHIAMHFVLNENVSDATFQIKNLVTGKVDNISEQNTRQTAEVILGDLKSHIVQ